MQIIDSLLCYSEVKDKRQACWQPETYFSSFWSVTDKSAKTFRNITDKDHVVLNWSANMQTQTKLVCVIVCMYSSRFVIKWKDNFSRIL